MNTIEWRRVMSVYHVSKNVCIIKIGRLSNDDRDSNENGEKTNRFTLAKEQLCTCMKLFCTCYMKLPNFTRPLYGVGEDTV